MNLPMLFHLFRLSSITPVFWYYIPVIPCITFQYPIPVNQVLIFQKLFHLSSSLPVLSSVIKFQYSLDCFSGFSFPYPIPQCLIFPIFIVPVSLLLLSNFLLFYSSIPVFIIPVPVPCFAFLLSVSRFSVFTRRI